MKILMLGSKEYPFNSGSAYERRPSGGIEKHVDKLSKYLSKNGHDVHIITRKFPGQKSKEDYGRIHVYRTFYIPNRYLRAFTFNMFGFLKAFYIANRVDIIHCHAPIAGFFGAIVSKLTGKPMVFTPHGLIVGWKIPLKTILKFFEHISLKSAKRVIFVSDIARKKLARKNPNNTLLTNAIDLDDYTFGRRKWKEIRFIFLGRLERFKGIMNILEAFEMLIDRYPNTKLIICGDGSERKRVIEFIESKNIKKKTEFIGWTNEPEKILSRSDVFLLPSSESGQPIALLEAMASGKIIITSLPYIQDGKTGLLVKPEDTKELYRKMLYVCKNFNRCLALGKNARNAVKKLSWDHVIKRFIEEYEKAIA